MVQMSKKMATAVLEVTAESQQKETHFSHPFHWEVWKSEWLSLAKLKACVEQSWNDSYLQQPLGFGGGVNTVQVFSQTHLTNVLCFRLFTFSHY